MPNTKEVKKAEGTIEEALPGGMFRVRLDGSDESTPAILGHLSGKMRMYRIKIIPGDRVMMEFSPYDDQRGRIVRRK
ncbi:MAG: translation initiation factor IF-1 [Candidatus Harrisonbacteria bacterium CG10_big_fil_rev_8_21_14_0_10_45_28]|uniref:Translation initiation factor IF-1 n=1 Tax=Candidatus Harrisonbacteria bacterium CG10_big_fil_rev_8_21_14_0_10_45_28 TaxID=1974586 RepID=A0A2H0UPP4_9BACT|nr:MAG: translation initiation factor IF-1 [Candidatus Harrisonbacteria bacterium CG10_big_fil_rev_8_21_14_0_10_45_28]